MLVELYPTIIVIPLLVLSNVFGQKRYTFLLKRPTCMGPKLQEFEKSVINSQRFLRLTR